MTVDYISRKAVEEMLEKAQIISDGEHCGCCTEDVCVSEIQAADVAPVVHGQWIFDGDQWDFRCANCRMWQGTNTRKYRYCPNCGAKMDGGADNAET